LVVLVGDRNVSDCDAKTTSELQANDAVTSRERLNVIQLAIAASDFAQRHRNRG
jgi:hypothetical protein